jgi:hypothetical protein
MSRNSLREHPIPEIAEYEPNLEFNDIRVEDIKIQTKKMRESKYMRQVDLDNSIAVALESLETNQDIMDKEIWNIREQSKHLMVWSGYQDDELEAIQNFLDTQRTVTEAAPIRTKSIKKRAELISFPQARPFLVPGYVKDQINVYCKETSMDFDGQGVFAKTDIQQDHFICSYRGDTEEHRENVTEKDCIGDTTFYDPQNHYYVIGNKVDSYGPNINDSSNYRQVNAQIRFSIPLGYAAVFATKRIKKDEEILTNYGIGYWAMANSQRTSKKREIPTIMSSKDNKKRNRQL